jgi:hypothetical protein
MASGTIALTHGPTGFMGGQLDSLLARLRILLRIANTLQPRAQKVVAVTPKKVGVGVP